MVRPLSRLAGAIALAFFFASPSSAIQGVEANSASAFKGCLEVTAAGAPVECVVNEQVVARTSGAAALTSVFVATLPISRVLDIEVHFEDPTGCFVWDHSGTEPANGGTPVDILQINVPAGVSAGSRLRIIDPCVREFRNGVAAGSSSTAVRGINVTGAGLSNVAISIENPRVFIKSSGAGTQVVAGSTITQYANPMDACATGSVRGGGLDPATGLMEWACRNYPFSAEIGGNVAGVSAYNTPTTPGGNSWTLLCTGDGIASNGTAQEGTNCSFAGERIRMYAMADAVLAQDQVRPGGVVYWPPGLYHDRYCGRQEDGTTPNGCPITRRDPTHQQRKLQQSRGIKWDFGRRDPDGPHLNGRSGAWDIADLGADLDGTTNGSSLAIHVVDPGGTSGYVPGHWGLTIGLSETANGALICARTTGSTGCVTSASSVRDVDREPMSVLGRNNGLIVAPFRIDPTQGGNVDVCIDNQPLVNGVCSADIRVLCNSNSGAARSADGASGSCGTGVGGPGGTCIGIAQAIEDELARNGDQITFGSQAAAGLYMVLDQYPVGAYGAKALGAGTFATTFASIQAVRNGQCGPGNIGRLVSLGGLWDGREFMSGNNEAFFQSMFNPFSGHPFYCDAVAGACTGTDIQPNKIAIVTFDKMSNVGGGIFGANIMPGSWVDRDSANDAADCLWNSSLTLNEPACDDVELVALAAGIGGGIYDSAVWYGGGLAGGSSTYAFSKIDGDTAGFWVEAKRNLFAKGIGLQTDASGWTYEDNVWLDTNAFSTQRGGGNAATAFLVGFSPGFRMARDKFVNLSGGDMISFTNSTGATIRDIEVSGLSLSGGILNIAGARRLSVDGITGHGVRGGSLIRVHPLPTLDIFDVDINNVKIDNLSTYYSGMTVPRALIAIEDVGRVGGRISGPINFRNISASVHGDERYCGVFMAGGSGDESNVANGSGRTIDDDRRYFNFDGISLEQFTDGTIGAGSQAFCLSNVDDSAASSAASNGPEDSLPSIGSSEGSMPAWRNLYGFPTNGVRYPDNLYPSQTAASVPDCGTTGGTPGLPDGTIVRVDDMPTAHTCTDTGSDGTLNGAAADPNKNTVLCKCDPAGNTASGAWAPL